MRPSSCCVWAALFLLMGVCAAQGPAPAPDCNAALVSLLPCLDYVQGNVSSPSQSCCGGVGSVLQSTPSCLCILFNSSALPIKVDPARALQLPALCRVTSPDPSLCGATFAPVPEPVPSPPVSAPAPPTAAPPGAPPAGTPPPMMATTPSVAPATPTTTTPTVAPVMTPVVAPSVPPPAPTAAVPAPAPVIVPTPVTTPSVAPVAPAPALTPLPSMSSPPAPPPASDDSHGAAIAASFLISGFVMVLSSILFLQL